MAQVDAQFHQLAKATLEHGYEYKTDNRKDTYYKGITSATIDLSLSKGLPILTTKKVNFKAVVTELLWFLRGDTNIKSLLDNGVNIWNQDAYNWYLKHVQEDAQPKDFVTFIDYVKEGIETDEEVKFGYEFGDVGLNYSAQWITFGSCVNQVDNTLRNLAKLNPMTRRHIVTAWNPDEIHDTALPPCHWAWEVLPFPLSLQQKIQLSGKDKVYLDTLWEEAFIKKNEEAKERLLKEVSHVSDYGFTLKWHQRSCDLFLGIPFNITSYALLSYFIGAVTNLMPVSIIGDLSNVHIYSQHFDAIKKQLQNPVNTFKEPLLKFSQNFYEAVTKYQVGLIPYREFIESLTPDDFILEGYQSFDAIKAPMIAED